MEDLKKDIEELIIARLKSLPEDLELVVGNDESFTIEELVKHVRDNDEIGKMYIETQLNYLRNLDKLPVGDEWTPDYTA